MNVILKQKNCYLNVKAIIDKSYLINENELAILKRNPMRGLLKPNDDVKKIIFGKQIVEYSGPIGTSLIDYLKKPIDKTSFFFIIAQITDLVTRVEKSTFSIGNIVFDVRYVYINNSTREIQFMYLPMLNNTMSVDILGFILNIISLAVISDDGKYISDFNMFLKNMHIYDGDSIDRYIATVDKAIITSVKRKVDVSSGFITDKPMEYYEHYKDKIENNYDEETGLLLDEDESYAETDLLVDDPEETSKLDEGLPEIKFPTLIRLSNSESVDIDKPCYRIGKERSKVDYFIANNNAISRSHADIVTKDNGNIYTKKYFIVDRNSTNHTYVNGNMIPIETEVEIKDGYEIRLANEDFIFNL